MLDSGMRESRETKVVIKDIEYSVFYKMLQFIYTHPPAIDSKDEAIQLLIAADRFQLLPLQSLAEAYLINSISKDLVQEFYAVAVTYNGVSLKDACLHWIVNNFPELSGQTLEYFIKYPNFTEQLNKFFNQYSATSYVPVSPTNKDDFIYTPKHKHYQESETDSSEEDEDISYSNEFINDNSAELDLDGIFY